MDYDCLIIDDDRDLNGLIADYFKKDGLATLSAHDYRDALMLISEHEFGCILLDVNLEDRSGFDLCSEIRKYVNTPIVFCSCRHGDSDILRALCIGGDDYVSKPFSLPVLTAKVKAIIRRTGKGEVLEIGRFTMNKAAMSVGVDGKQLNLSATEYELLKFLLENHNRVIDKSECLSAVWGKGYYSPDTLNVYIRKLREKIETEPNNPEFIKTIWGVGYILKPSGRH